MHAFIWEYEQAEIGHGPSGVRLFENWNFKSVHIECSE
jgi:hypothetical protein